MTKFIVYAVADPPDGVYSSVTAWEEITYQEWQNNLRNEQNLLNLISSAVNRAIDRVNKFCPGCHVREIIITGAP